MSANLLSAIRGCKVETSYANKIQSQRFQDSNVMLCPTWTGTDLVGRSICPDSFYTKSAGCNSAEDRVYVENYQRPQYAEYIGINMLGLAQDGPNGTSNTEHSIGVIGENYTTTSPSYHGANQLMGQQEANAENYARWSDTYGQGIRVPVGCSYASAQRSLALQDGETPSNERWVQSSLGVDQPNIVGHRPQMPPPRGGPF